MPTSRIKTFLGVSVVILFVIGLHYTTVGQSLERLFRSLLQLSSVPIYSWSVSIGGTEKKFDSVEALQKAYEETVTELQEAERNDALCRDRGDENISLRETLNFLSHAPIATVGADVIGKDIAPLGNILFINRGERDGVTPGQPVIIGRGILIGKIVRVDEDRATVRLLSDSQSRVAATVSNHDHSIGIVEGGYGISVRMTFIPQHEVVTPGDIIMTSGLETNIPRGLLIGTVEAVEKEAYQPFQRAVLTPSAALDKLTSVSVLLGGSTSTSSL